MNQTTDPNADGLKESQFSKSYPTHSTEEAVDKLYPGLRRILARYTLDPALFWDRWFLDVHRALRDIEREKVAARDVRARIRAINDLTLKLTCALSGAPITSGPKGESRNDNLRRHHLEHSIALEADLALQHAAIQRGHLSFDATPMALQLDELYAISLRALEVKGKDGRRPSTSSDHLILKVAVALKQAAPDLPAKTIEADARACLSQFGIRQTRAVSKIKKPPKLVL